MPIHTDFETLNLNIQISRGNPCFENLIFRGRFVFLFSVCISERKNPETVFFMEFQNPLFPGYLSETESETPPRPGDDSSPEPSRPAG